MIRAIYGKTKNYCNLFITILFLLFITQNCKAQFEQSYTLSGEYELDGETASIENATYKASETDQCAVYVFGAGNLTLKNCEIKKSGNTTSNDNSSFYGLNAGVLAETYSTINLVGCKITTIGTGANGVFATDQGSFVSLTNDTIYCYANGGHGIDATYGGAIEVKDCIIYTTGAHGAAISTDRGGGTINLSGGTATATGTDSPGIYSTGNITVTDAIIEGTNSEAAVIEGTNSITVINSKLTAGVGTRNRGLFIYQSMSGDSEGFDGVFTMTGGIFNWPSTTGSAIYLTNTTGTVNLSDVEFNNSSPILLKVSADRWGRRGSNGANVVLNLENQSLKGEIICDTLSTCSISMKNNSSLISKINGDETATSVSLTLDSSSSLTLTADSYINKLIDLEGISASSILNITGNGFNIYYDKTLAENKYLNGATYSLKNGGKLIPLSTK